MVGSRLSEASTIVRCRKRHVESIQLTTALHFCFNATQCLLTGDYHNDQIRQEVYNAVISFRGVDSISCEELRMPKHLERVLEILCGL